MPFPDRQRSAVESGNQEYRAEIQEKKPLCFESERSIILRHN